MEIVPNLFGQMSKSEIHRMYELYLSRLRQQNRLQRVLEACRQIRAYALRARHPGWAYFTYHVEVDALCKLRNFTIAWRQLRRWERECTGSNLSLKATVWTPSELNWFFHYHPNVLYFLGKYFIAGRMIEAVLDNLMVRSRKGMSFTLLRHIYKPIAQPRSRQEVTLYHVYRKQRKSLLEWPHWGRFVRGFDPRLFHLTGIQSQDLLHNPALLKPFCNVIEKEREQRLIANASYGEKELIDSPKKVRRYQISIARKKARLDKHLSKRGTEEKLLSLFPELRQSKKAS